MKYKQRCFYNTKKKTHTEFPKTFSSTQIYVTQGSAPFIGNLKGKKKDTPRAAPALELTFRNNEVLLTQVVKAIKMKKSYANVIVIYSLRWLHVELLLCFTHHTYKIAGTTSAEYGKRY